MDNQPRGIPPPADVRIAEKPMPMELKLPEMVKAELLQGASRILSRIGSYDARNKVFTVSEQAPDRILLLMRSARLPMETVQAYLASVTVEGRIPPVSEAGIGKFISLAYIDELMEADDSIEEDVPLSQVAEPFTRWLARDGNAVAGPIIAGLRRDQQTIQGRNPHFLVVDDARGVGDTLDYTVGPIIAKAFPGATWDPELFFANPLPQGKGWEFAIVDENYPGVSKGERYFLHELLKGLLDRRILERELQFIEDSDSRKAYKTDLETLSKPGEDFIPVTNEGALRLLAYHSRLYNLDQRGTPALDIYQSLENRFGKDYLLGLPRLAERAFRKASEDIKL